MKKPVSKLRIILVSIKAGWRMFKHCYENMKAVSINFGDSFEVKYTIKIEFAGKDE